MTKKDEKDADRPHYYSQFWLDVAAGRKVIGGPKSEDGTDQAEADLPEPIPMARKGGRANPGIVPMDGYRETRAPAAVADEAYDEDEEEEDEFSLPEDEEPDMANEVSDEDIPSIVDDTPEESVPDIEPELAEEEEEEPDEDEEFYDEEEEEDEDEWSSRGRKKPKPGRQAKVPKPPAKKPPRRGGRF